MKKRQGNNPKRRVAPGVSLTNGAWLQDLAQRVRYVGSGHHKRYPADYGFERTNPIPSKSLCDAIMPVSLVQAQAWLFAGILHGMISSPAPDGFPKYVWFVTDDGQVFEAKTHPSTPGLYHGYPLEEEDLMRKHIRSLWEQKCQAN